MITSLDFIRVTNGVGDDNRIYSRVRASIACHTRRAFYSATMLCAACCRMQMAISCTARTAKSALVSLQCFQRRILLVPWQMSARADLARAFEIRPRHKFASSFLLPACVSLEAPRRCFDAFSARRKTTCRSRDCCVQVSPPILSGRYISIQI